MPTSKNDEVTKELAKSLDSATSLLNDLLGDIRNNATSLAVLKTKLESLSNSVESLSSIVRDGNGKGSMITRVALLEQSVNHIEETLDEFKEEACEAIKEIKKEIEQEKNSTDKDSDFKRESLLARLKIIAVIAPGAIALGIMIVKMIMGIE
jgi:CHASE3 domain sensor protein